MYHPNNRIRFSILPDDPENIPYRGISDGQVTGYTNGNDKNNR